MKTRPRQAREVGLSSKPPAEQGGERRRRAMREKTKKTEERGDKGRLEGGEGGGLRMEERDRKGEEAEAVG